MPEIVNVKDAQSLFGDRFVGPADVAKALSVAAGDIPVPHSLADLKAASAAGEVLIYRTARAGSDPLTIRALIARFPSAFDPKLLQTSGYQLKNEWGIELEPLAATDTCTDGWALVQPQVLKDSCNLAYDQQTAALRAYESRNGLAAGSTRRRTAVEAVYDTVMLFASRGMRTLEKTWDWTSSTTLDRGILHVGGFGSAGMQVLGYSPGIRHGGLGVCPSRQLNS